MAALAASMPGQQGASPGKPAPFVLPPGEITVPRLAELFGNQLRRNFLLPASGQSGQPLSLTEPLRLDSEAACERALENLLFAAGFGVLPLAAGHGLYEIASFHDARGLALLEAAVWQPCEAVLARPEGKQLVLTFVPLQNVVTAPVVNALRSMSPGVAGQGPEVVSATDAGVILLGCRDQVAGLIGLVRANDQPEPDSGQRQAAMAQVQALGARLTALGAELAALDGLRTPIVAEAVNKQADAPVTASELAMADPGPFVLEKGEVTVSQLVERAARHLNWQVRCTEQEPGTARPFQIREPLRLDAAGCEDVLCALLSARELALVPEAIQRRFEVVSLTGKRGKEVYAAAIELTPEEVLRRPHRKRVVTTTVPLRNVHGAFVVNQLQPLYYSRSPSHLDLPQQRGARSVLMTGFQDQVAHAIELVQAVDVRPLRPPSAAELEQQIKGLLGRLTALQAQLAERRKEAGK